MRALVALVLGFACLITACADDGEPEDVPTVDTGAPRSTTTTTVAVDPALGPRTIEIVGTPSVGARLVARISPDLVDRIESWNWHRCIDIPACPTITSADGPAYIPTDADAWHVLRVIAVADGKAVETRVGPIVNPSPRPFTDEFTLDPSRNGNRLLTVGPGRLRIEVDADCPVTLLGGVHAASVDDERAERQLGPTEPGRHIDESIDSPGGQLVVVTDGDCDRAAVRVSGTR
jgi:hypothetical protein